jgi:hypothetical protein
MQQSPDSCWDDHEDNGIWRIIMLPSSLAPATRFYAEPFESSPWPYILFPFRFLLGCDRRQGMDWILDLLTHLYTPLRTTSNYCAIANVHTSPITTAPTKLFFSACCVFNSYSLATASNSGDSLASCAHVITVQWISCNWTLANCQLNYSANSSHPSLQNSTQQTHSLTNHSTPLHYTTLNCTHLAWDPCCIVSRGGATENTASNSPSVVVMGSCLAMVWILFLRECVYWAITMQCMLLVIVP